MKRNENKTFKYLKQLLPGVEITRQFHIKGPIVENGEVVREYLLADFEFKIGHQQVIVEFNGAQHFKAVRKWGGKIALASQRKRDAWLRKYCLANGIKLIEIDGRTTRGKDIENELRKRLKTP
jgi:very-short-patch-repair endonuclease